MRSFVIALCVLGLVVSVRSQDTLDAFTYPNIRDMVLRYHPIAKQAALRTDMGEQSVRSARGNFDPKLEGTHSNKFYKGTQYYDITNAQIKIPTIAAAEIKGGIDLNNGTYLNPEMITPDNGLYYAGISMPLLQGLLIDERRATLRQAQAYQEFTRSEQRAILNDLMFGMGQQYWQWWAAAERVRVAEEMTDIAMVRFEAVKARAEAGDRPMIDTVEAFLQVQLRTQVLQEERVNEVKQRLGLSTYLWTDSDGRPLPVVIAAGNRPVIPYSQDLADLQADSAVANFDALLATIAERHPMLGQYDAKLQSLEVEERWKREKLKPKLNVQYNVLSTGVAGSEEDDLRFSTNNYKWGVEFSMPLFLREARGELALQRLKISETNWSRDQKETELRNKARAAYESLFLLEEQRRIARMNLANYSTLLEAERLRFFNGESSLFLVNQREMALADARTKVVEIELKTGLALNEVYYQLGLLIP